MGNITNWLMGCKQILKSEGSHPVETFLGINHPIVSYVSTTFLQNIPFTICFFLLHMFSLTYVHHIYIYIPQKDRKVKSTPIVLNCLVSL